MKTKVEYKDSGQRQDLINTNTALGYRLEADEILGFGDGKKKSLTFTDEPYVENNPEKDKEEDILARLAALEADVARIKQALKLK